MTPKEWFDEEVKRVMEEIDAFLEKVTQTTSLLVVAEALERLTEQYVEWADEEEMYEEPQNAADLFHSGEGKA